MAELIKRIFEQEYPGRLIIIGKTPAKRNVVVYAVTGRSPSSRARQMVAESDTIWVKPTDPEVLKKGNIDLLIYPPAFMISQGVAVSNGKQTVDVMASMSQSRNASEVLAFSLQKWEYEPDDPNYTPRISGCLLSSGSAALSIIKKSRDEGAFRGIYEFPLAEGKGRFISTYSGENIDPLPSFEGEPIEIEIKCDTAADLAEIIFESLENPDPRQDFRVAVAAIVFDKTDASCDISIINRHEREK